MISIAPSILGSLFMISRDFKPTQHEVWDACVRALTPQPIPLPVMWWSWHNSSFDLQVFLEGKPLTLPLLSCLPVRTVFILTVMKAPYFRKEKFEVEHSSWICFGLAWTMHSLRSNVLSCGQHIVLFHLGYLTEGSLQNFFFLHLSTQSRVLVCCLHRPSVTLLFISESGRE